MILLHRILFTFPILNKRLDCLNAKVFNLGFITDEYRVAEVVRGHGGPPPKSLDSVKNFNPEHTLFCRKLRFVAIYALFGDLLAKKSAFLGQKQCFLGKKCTITWYILHILLS